MSFFASGDAEPKNRLPLLEDVVLAGISSLPPETHKHLVGQLPAGLNVYRRFPKPEPLSISEVRTALSPGPEQAAAFSKLISLRQNHSEIAVIYPRKMPPLLLEDGQLDQRYYGELLNQLYLDETRLFDAARDVGEDVDVALHVDDDPIIFTEESRMRFSLYTLVSSQVVTHCGRGRFRVECRPLEAAEGESDTTEEAEPEDTAASMTNNRRQQRRRDRTTRMQKGFEWTFSRTFGGEGLEATKLHTKRICVQGNFDPLDTRAITIKEERAAEQIANAVLKFCCPEAEPMPSSEL